MQMLAELQDAIRLISERVARTEADRNHFWERLRTNEMRTHQVELHLSRMQAETRASRQAKDDRRAMRREALGFMTWIASIGVLALAALGYIPPEIAKAISSALGRGPW